MSATMKEFQKIIPFKNLKMAKMMSSRISKSQFEDSIGCFNVSHKKQSLLEYTLVP